MSLALELLANRRLELFLVGGAETLATALQCLALDRRQDAGGLLAPHDRGARIRPLEQEARAVGPAAHGVIPGTKTAADHDGVLRHRRAGHGGHQFGAVLGDAAGPTMKPAMFCRKTRGMPSRQHNSMKCVPFKALSENKMPLFANIPTVVPGISANTH